MTHYSSDWELPSFIEKVFSPKKHDYCLGIPVLNEGEKIQKQLIKMKETDIPQLVDIIIADGGSTDNALEELFLQKNSVIALLKKTGEGKLSAQLRMLFAYALVNDYKGIILIDGNNKDGVEAIEHFISELNRGVDYIQGSRYIKGGFEENTPLSRKIAVKLLHAPLLSLASGFHYTDTTNGFRAISRRVLENSKLAIFRNVFDDYNLHYYLSLHIPRQGYLVKEIPVTRVYPKIGPIPSKIKGWHGNFIIFKTLIKTILGHYNV